MARPKSDIQERIVAAAHRRFVAEGVEAASLRNIAKDAETSIGMVYYYYTTKDDLFLAVVEETYQSILSDLEQVLREGDSFRDKMQGLYRRAGNFSKHELEIMTLIAREGMTSAERRKRLFRLCLRGHVALLLGMVVEGMKSGELDSLIHPVVATACCIGIGAVPSVMVQLAREQLEQLSSDDEANAVLRAVTGDVLQQLPDRETLARTLSEVVMRALGSRSDVTSTGRA